MKKMKGVSFDDEINYDDIFDGIDDDVVLTPAFVSDYDSGLPVPFDDIDQLDNWLSNCDNNSFSSSNQFHISSPISVLDNSSSSNSNSRDNLCSANKLTQSKLNLHSRARSKRSRPRSFVPQPTSYEELCSSASPKKTTRIKVLPFPKTQNVHALSPQGLRKCLHCEATNTPQWRAGPLGRKTLCNACGVRYKSGRLFPEYRPVASPSFVPSLHSNSHKKVLQMRNKQGESTTELIRNTETTTLSLVTTDRKVL